MSTRLMMVQYVGDTLRLPVVDEGGMRRPFGSSVLERDVRRIAVNPFSDSPQTFVPESENAKLREEFDKMDVWHSKELSAAMAENVKLRELVRWMYDRMDESCAVQHPYAPTPISYDRLMQALARTRELGVEVEG